MMRQVALPSPMEGDTGSASVHALARLVGRPRRTQATALQTAIVVLLAGLAAYATLLRLQTARLWFWIDEGLSVGISSHHLGRIPGLLHQDGSPPLYYLVLHVWMRLFGRSEAGTHALSLVLAFASIPVALWLARSLFGPRAGWVAGLLAATNPFLTYYGGETRMYTLMSLVALVATGAFVHAFAFGRRRWVPVFTVALIALLYTHNWGLFFALGCVAALVPCVLATADRRTIVVDAAIAFGVAAVAYIPWLPTLLYQSHHTGAPWSTVPSLREAISEVSSILGDERVLVALLLTAGASLGASMIEPRSRDGAALLSIGLIFVVPLAAAWLTSQVQPAWATRYFAMILAPVLLLAAVGLARTGALGVAALVLVTLFWVHPLGHITGDRPADRRDEKSNVKAAMAGMAPRLGAGDLVVSTQPEQVPVLRYYLGGGLQFATETGAVPDPRLVDWRDALRRLRATSPEANLYPMVATMRPGQHLLLVAPVLAPTSKDPAWIHLIHQRSQEWEKALGRDPRLRFVTGYGSPTGIVPGTPVYALLFERLRT